VSEKEFRYRDFLSTPEPAPRPSSDDSLARFASELDSRGVELSDVLQSFDVRRSGRITTANFLRTFDSSASAKAVAAQYDHPLTHEIDYVQIERDMARVTRLAGGRLRPKPKPEVSTAEIPSFFPQVALQIREAQIDCKSTLAVYDHRKKHRITRRDFVQELAQWRLKITAGQREQVANAFSDANGDIDYEQFADEVTLALNSAPHSARWSTFEVKPNASNVIEFLKETARNRHSQIETAVKALDPEQTGIAPAGRFARCLSGQDFKVTPADVEALTIEFGDGRGNIEYPRFLAAILPQNVAPTPELSNVLARLGLFLNERKIAIRPTLERYRPLTANDLIAVLRKLSFDLNPQEQAILRASFRTNNIDVEALCARIDYLPPPRDEPPPEVMPIIRGPPPDDVLTILAKMTAAEQRAPYDFLAEFRERDTFKNGQIATSQLQAVLLGSSVGLTRSEVERVVGHYQLTPQKVDYKSLIADKDRLSEAEDTGPQTVEELLAAFKIALQNRKIPPRDLFVRHDRSHNGKVPVLRVRSIFDSVGIKLNEEDDRALREAFKDQQSPDEFDYYKLCAVLAAGDEKPAGGRELQGLLYNIRERIQARKRRIREAFPESLGESISEQIFRDALATFGLSIREQEIQRLLKEYRLNRQKDIDWHRFVTDVETARVPN
jgi:Ca2+-binding EF-hand superfamily protein